mmetsp:Transcript_10678/g.32896  ORF Transcript_10678/g.32896 Transcript_10678/m.32896 type:complete len:84 (-) Transcript_10678:15-266(-)
MRHVRRRAIYRCAPSQSWSDFIGGIYARDKHQQSTYDGSSVHQVNGSILFLLIDPPLSFHFPLPIYYYVSTKLAYYLAPNMPS